MLKWRGEYAAPGSWAKPMDQGKAGTCTVYAVVNAVCTFLMRRNINVDNKIFLGGLLQKVHDTNGRPPSYLDGKVVNNIMDKKSGNYYDINIKVLKTIRPDPQNAEYVLVYPTGEVRMTKIQTHCVFVRKFTYDRNGVLLFDCINSWGNEDPFPERRSDCEGTLLFEVKSTWKDVGNAFHEDESDDIDKKLSHCTMAVPKPFLSDRLKTNITNKARKDVTRICTRV